ncbi:MAG: TOBE domain-containing protein [Campylobacterales bacterium]|nr:TOBE domain-containing protein [Campylobacterales bacterium]
MNRVRATVKSIQSVEKLNIVSFEYFTQTLSMMSLELGENIQPGTTVQLGFKSTAVGIAKEFVGGLSYSNRLPATIDLIEKGELLSSISLKLDDTYIESVITTASLLRMQLREGDSVEALIKASEVFIEEVV